MLQSKQSISIVQITETIAKSTEEVISESDLSIESQNLRMQPLQAEDIGFISTNNYQPVLVDKNISLKILKLVQSKVNERLVAFSFYQLRENCLVSRGNNNFSVMLMSPLSQELIENPQSELLGLQSKCQENDQERPRPNNVRMLTKKMFSLKLENQKLSRQVADLKEEIEENVKRQHKEVMKKRESLEGLMEEISDKNELIEELKLSIRILQAKLGAKDKGVLQCLLQEDSESLRKTIVRLQAVNDKLNFNLEINKKEMTFYESQNKRLAQKCEQMEKQVRRLKQQVFDLEANHEIVDIMKKEVDLTEKRYKTKIQKTKKLQKKLSEVIKFKENIFEFQTETDLQTLTKKNDSSSTASNIKRTSSMKSEVSESKLEAVLNFIFHIAQESYQLEHQLCFDDQQKQLLKIHKQIFLKNRKNHQIPNQKLQAADLSFFFGKSLHEALDHNEINKSIEIKEKKMIASLQKQCQNLISKICELKEKHMHVRQVVMSFLKSFELKPLRKESETMLNLVYQIFQYSQVERVQFFPPKSRKLFGFI